MGFFSSWSLFSSPSTRLRRASRTSVLGPRFFGIASDESVGWSVIRIWRGVWATYPQRCALTINAWALEDLAGLAAGTQAIAFDLEK